MRARGGGQLLVDQPVLLSQQEKTLPTGEFFSYNNGCFGVRAAHDAPCDPGYFDLEKE